MDTQLQIEKISEAELIAMFANEKQVQQAFRILVIQYQERLYWHIRRFVHNHEDANDIIQNVFIKIFKSIKNFNGNSKLYTWLYRIATNEAITFIKKNKKHKQNTISEYTEKVSKQLKADEYFDGDKAQILLKKAIEALPQKQKLVFNMRYYDELSYKDIAEILGVSVGGLKASYFHAVKKVKAYVIRAYEQ